jgi:hypothetical protein
MGGEGGIGEAGASDPSERWATLKDDEYGGEVLTHSYTLRLRSPYTPAIQMAEYTTLTTDSVVRGENSSSVGR